MNEIVLPWPDRALHPNARCHWSRKAKAAKAARMVGFVLARQAGWRSLSLPDGDIHLRIEGYPPVVRKRDADGLLSSCKPALDGIADSLGIDDSRFVPHPRVMPEIRKGGEVRIWIDLEGV